LVVTVAAIPIVAASFRPLRSRKSNLVGAGIPPGIGRWAGPRHESSARPLGTASASAGDRQCEARLFEVVYDELRRMAAAQLRKERPDHTLQRSALVNEAYLRLFGPHPVTFVNRGHFFSTAASTMRRILSTMRAPVMPASGRPR
jgi:ECF sigma factor